MVAALGCSQSDFGGFPTPSELPEAPEGPGHPAWGDADISCNVQSDCAPTESCEGNVCMPARCSDGPYASDAPIGPVYVFYQDKEILAADSQMVSGGYWIDGYLPTESDINYRSGGSWNMGGGAILDVAGGNVLGQRPDAAIAVVAGSAQVHIRHDNGDSTMDIDFQPIAVAAGDIDQDSVDEIIALGSSGQYAICDAVEGECNSYTIEGAAEGYDVTVGDVDGDNFGEPVFHVEKHGDEHILALNYDFEETGEPKWVGGTSDGYVAISAGTVDDGPDKVIALRDGGGFGWLDDKLDTLQIGATTVSKLGTASVSEDSHDVELADLDMDGRAEIALLQGEAEVQLRRPISASSHTVMVTKTLSATDAPSRIGLADVDGDSPVARKVGGPHLVPGGVTPIMALQFPPYSQTFSDRPGYLFIGQTENISEDFSDSMSVRYGVGVGFDAKIKGVVKAGFMARFGQEWGSRRSLGTRYTIGSRFSIEPDVDLYGNDFSVVMLSSGCFHAYSYEIDDPVGALDDELNGSTMGMMVPVGGQVTVWSSKRYNALARHLGNLPVIETPVRIGDPSSYPSSPMTTRLEPVQDEDKVFPHVPKLDVSDVGVVGYWLAAAETETNETSKSIDLSGYGNVGVGPVTLNFDVGLNQGRSHSVTVGNEAIFGGGVPPIPDDPNTPEDEHAANGFSYSPEVHREFYTDANGNEAGYYVLTFTVGDTE